MTGEHWSAEMMLVIAKMMNILNNFFLKKNKLNNSLPFLVALKKQLDFEVRL